MTRVDDICPYDIVSVRYRVRTCEGNVDTPVSLDSTAKPTAWWHRLRDLLQLPNPGNLLLAIVLALIIWFLAMNQENPLSTDDFGERVPVTVLGLGEGMALVQDLSDETVKLRLRAPRSSWESLDVSDFRVSIDLTDLGPGEHDVVVKATSLDPQVHILDVQRPQLRVTIDPFEQKEVPVHAEIMDSTAFGYDPLASILSPMTVTVSGPASQVQQVVKARTEVYLRNAKSQVEHTQPLTPADAQNRTVAGVILEPSLVQVVVPVEQWPGRKEVAVRVKLSGRPADGYRLSTVKVEPSTVVLEGESDVLSAVPGYVETEPLALDGAAGEVRKRLKLILPPGVTSFDGDTVVGTAGVAPIEGGVTIAQPLVQQGLGQGLMAESALQDVDVILSGPVPLLDSLNSDDLFVILELTGLVTGTHAVKPKVVLPDGIRVEGVIPETVEVVIAQREGATAPEAPLLPALPMTATHTQALTTTGASLLTPAPAPTPTATVGAAP